MENIWKVHCAKWRKIDGLHFYCKSKIKNTIPMTFIVEKQRLITISNHKNTYVIKRMATYLESHEIISIYKFLFASLEIISNAYYPVIEEMDKSKDEISVN